MTFSISIDAWPNGAPIPARFAFGKPGTDGPFATSDNQNPAVRWSGPPAGTRSFALICVDPDVPSVGHDVNQPGKTVPASLPRVDFYHWLLADLPVETTEIPLGVASSGVTARGKPVGPSLGGVTGANDYTGWFHGDADMEGVYGGYDGPCPPWNDSIVHHYHFRIYALDVPSLELDAAFTGADLQRAMSGHILAQAEHVGTYSMNPNVPAR